MKKFAFIFGIALLTACAGKSEKVYLRTEKGPRPEASNVEANSMLTLEIEGMTCEMGCGGTIRKGLRETGGVSRVKYDFVEGKKIQKAYVSFDDNVVSEKEMIEIVTSLNDHQFKVGKHHVEKLENEDKTSSTETAGDEAASSVKMDEEGFQIPNLINILKDLIVN